MRQPPASPVNPWLFLNPLVVQTFDPLDYQLSMPVREFMFWFFRVQQYSITCADLHVNGNPVGFPSGTAFAQGGSGAATDEVDAYRGFSFLGSETIVGESWTFAFGTNGLGVNPILPNTGPTPHEYKPLLTLESSSFTTRLSSGFSPGGVNVLLQGTNLPDGESYSRSVGTFSPNTVTGTVIITPSLFWAYADPEGVALYDTSTGAKL